MKLFRITAVITVIAAVCAFIVFGDAKTNMKGKKVSLDAPIADFRQPALVEGNITFVYGPYATMERDKKTYNGSESEIESYYYIVSDLDNGVAFASFTTSDESLAAKLSDAADQWYNYLVDETGEVKVPEVSISFSGKLDKPQDDENYQMYYNDAVKELGYTGIAADEFTELTIYEGAATDRTVKLFFIYSATAAAGLIALTVMLIRMKKIQK